MKTLYVLPKHLTLPHCHPKINIFSLVSCMNSKMLYWRQNSQNHASCTSHLCYDPNTHAVPKVETLLESIMQGLLFESLWMGHLWCIMDFLFLVYVFVFLRQELELHIVTNPTITPQNDVCLLQQQYSCCAQSWCIVGIPYAKEASFWVTLDGHVVWGNIAFWYTSTYIPPSLRTNT